MYAAGFSLRKGLRNQFFQLEISAFITESGINWLSHGGGDHKLADCPRRLWNLRPWRYWICLDMVLGSQLQAAPLELGSRWGDFQKSLSTSAILWMGCVNLHSSFQFENKISICFTFTVKSKDKTLCCGTFRTDSFSLVQKCSFLFGCQWSCALTLLSGYFSGWIGGALRIT